MHVLAVEAGQLLDDVRVVECREEASELSTERFGPRRERRTFLCGEITREDVVSLKLKRIVNLKGIVEGSDLSQSLAAP